MRQWLTRNAEPLGAIASVATAVAALSVLVVVPYQIGQADLIQRDQTAREIYREFLNLTIQKPELATADICTLQGTRERVAYGAYADYLLFTAEQMIDTSPEWQLPMLSYLTDHKAYFCSDERGAAMRGIVAEIGLICTVDDLC